MKQRRKFGFLSSGVIFGLVATFLLATPFVSAGQAFGFGNSADTKKNVALIKKLSITEAKLIGRYEAVTGKNYQDDYTTGTTLIALLPDVNTFIGKLEALSPKDAKLKSAVNLWVKGWNKQAEGLSLIIGALDQQDYELLAKGNAALASARATLKKAATALKPFLSS